MPARTTTGMSASAASSEDAKSRDRYGVPAIGCHNLLPHHGIMPANAPAFARGDPPRPSTPLLAPRRERRPSPSRYGLRQASDGRPSASASVDDVGGGSSAMWPL